MPRSAHLRASCRKLRPGCRLRTGATGGTVLTPGDPIATGHRSPTGNIGMAEASSCGVSVLVHTAVSPDGWDGKQVTGRNRVHRGVGRSPADMHGWRTLVIGARASL